MTAPVPTCPRWRAVLGVAVAFLAALSSIATPVPAGAATGPPLPSALWTATDSWAVVPMGQLTDPSNTFWQLLRASPDAARWSVVTPKGAADNGGLVAGVAPGGALAAVLPSGLLRFSPLSDSDDGGQTWTAGLLPGALAARPDALAYEPGAQGGALAIVGMSVLRAAPGLASWSRLVSLDQLRAAAPACVPVTLSAVAFAQNGDPLVAAQCRRGGAVLLTDTADTWRSVPATARPLRGAATVLRLETMGSATVALASSVTGGRQNLAASWQSATGAWSTSAALRLPAGASVRATAIGAGGVTGVLAGTSHALSAFEVSPGGSWVRLPTPPARAVALALPGTSTAAGGVDLFVVDGTQLGVFALTPAGSRWVRIQTTQVALAYGSSG